MNNSSNNILESKDIKKLFLKYSIPSVLAMIITGSQTIIDGLFVGNLIGPNSLAAINIVKPFIELVLGSGFVISIGMVSIIGRRLGEGCKEEAQDTFRTSTILLLTVCMIIGIMGVLFSSQISRLLGASKLLLADASTYMFCLSLFFPFIGLNIILGFACRVIGKPERYLQGSIVSLCVNIIGDLIFVKYLKFGMGGAALATALAYSVSFIIVLIPMSDRRADINLFKGKFNKKLIVPTLYNGGSEGITSFSAAITTYLFNMTFMRIAGEAGVVAFTSICYLSHFGILLVFGISDGIGPIISYKFGNKRFDQIKEVMILSYKVQAVIGIVMFSIMFFFNKALIQMFSSVDKDVLQIAVLGAKIYSFMFIMSGFNIVSSGFFTAIGGAKTSMVISMARGLVFILCGINILPHIFGVTGIWLTVPTAELLTVMICLYYHRRFKEKNKQVLGTNTSSVAI